VKCRNTLCRAAGEKAISSTSKCKSDKTLHILSTFLDGPIKPHRRVMVDGKTCPAIFRDRLIPSSQIPRSVTVTFAFLRRIGAASYR
jgi:hypothetical protein